MTEQERPRTEAGRALLGVLPDLAGVDDPEWLDNERLAKALEAVFLLNLDPTGLTPEWWKERAREVVIVIRDE